MVPVPGPAEPEPGLCREGDLATITFSTQQFKAKWDLPGPEKTLNVYNTESKGPVCEKLRPN